VSLHWFPGDGRRNPLGEPRLALRAGQRGYPRRWPKPGVRLSGDSYDGVRRGASSPTGWRRPTWMGRRSWWLDQGPEGKLAAGGRGGPRTRCAPDEGGHTVLRGPSGGVGRTEIEGSKAFTPKGRGLGRRRLFSGVPTRLFFLARRRDGDNPETTWTRRWRGSAGRCGQDDGLAGRKGAVVGPAPDLEPEQDLGAHPVAL